MSDAEAASEAGCADAPRRERNPSALRWAVILSIVYILGSAPLFLLTVTLHAPDWAVEALYILCKPAWIVYAGDPSGLLLKWGGFWETIFPFSFGPP